MAKKLTQEKIIEQLKKIHGNIYDYSLVKYKNDSSKIQIICKNHGVFEQRVGCHKRQKQGCPQCFKERMKNSELNRSVDNLKFIERIENIYSKGTFDFKYLEYNGAHRNVTLVCSKCQNIETKPPSVWYRGFGCLRCKGSTVGAKICTTKEFIIKAKKIHGNKYNYDKSSYVGNNEKIEIICSKHGSFWQTPNIHINGKCGCPKCKTSKGEEEIAIWLNEHNIKYIYQYKINIHGSNHYYDFYLYEYNIIIEYNGKQHYEPIHFFGGKEGFLYLLERDKIKHKFCIQNNIKLINISYKDDINNILTNELQK